MATHEDLNHLGDLARLNPDIVTNIIDCLALERNSLTDSFSIAPMAIQRTFHALSVACCGWSPFVTLRLYDTIILHSAKALEVLIKTLQARKDLREHVRKFYFIGTIFGTDHLLISHGKETDNIGEMVCNLFPEIPLENQIGRSFAFLPSVDDLQGITWLNIVVTSTEFFRSPSEVPSSVTLSALWNLCVLCRENDYLPGTSTPSEPSLPQMPNLRVVTLRGFVLHQGQTLNFSSSPKLNVINLLEGDYQKLPNLFAFNGPLAPCQNSLESLTITARDLGPRELGMQGFDLGFLRNLVELCIPSQCFTRGKGIIKDFPPQLTDFALIGEDINNNACGLYVKCLRAMLSIEQGRPPQHLKRVQVLVNNSKDVLGREIMEDFKNAEVELILGTERLRYTLSLR
ncbi:hypothetical protein ACEPAI_10049 [Sanghuangporus weigelae]